MNGFHARRRFGQNFLTDSHWIGRIIEAINPGEGESIVEIGPGQAALTAGIIEACGHVTAVEIDRDLAAMLRERFSPEKLTLIEADALSIDWEKLAGGGRLRIVGNLPYNISSPLLFRLLPAAGLVTDQHFMLQKEVVDRMAAPPGSKTYGRLSVMLQHRYRITRLFDVPPGAFSPAPKVTSSVVRMVPKRPEEMDDADISLLEAIAAAAFGQRRKTLRNSLAKYFSEAELSGLGIDPARRAETLSSEEYSRLSLAARDKGTPLKQGVRTP